MAAVPKDERLARVAKQFNVAQFVSFSPGSQPTSRFSLLRGMPSDTVFNDPADAVRALFAVGAPTVNVRSFLPDREQGNPFVYGLDTVDAAVAAIRSLAGQGYLSIVNETIDVHDGGVSGVALADTIEFAPDVTPRGVEQVQVASLPYQIGMRVLSGVYRLQPALPSPAGARVEFSLHPLRVGYRRERSLIWDCEQQPGMSLAAVPSWPNAFSRVVGDKTFGLLVADAIGLRVPMTTVVSRRIAPFGFGRPTGTGEIWARPCPTEQRPGLYPTTLGWLDPSTAFDHKDIVAVLAQEGVAAAYSGATLPGDAADDHVDGVAGTGDQFMMGNVAPVELPEQVRERVRAVLRQAKEVLGPVRIEWVYDGAEVWVVQLHVSSDRYRGSIISPGTPDNGWLDFDPRSGLATLRELVERARTEGHGVRVTGAVGLTSHAGDILRRAAVPAILHTGT